MSSNPPSEGTFFVDQSAQPPAAPPPPLTPPAAVQPAAAPAPTPEAPAAPEAAQSETMRDVPLGTLIFRAGLLAEEQLEDALQEGMRTGKRLGEVLLERGWLHERDLGRLLAGQKGLPFVELSGVSPDPTAVPLVPEEKARMQNALAIAFEKGVPVVAVADPTNDLVLENLRRVLGCEPRLVVAAHGDLQRKIDEAYAPVEVLPATLEPAAEPPVRASGPGEGTPGEPGGSPAPDEAAAPVAVTGEGAPGESGGSPATYEASAPVAVTPAPEPAAVAPPAEPAAQSPVRDSGPGEGAPGEPGGSPAPDEAAAQVAVTPPPPPEPTPEPLTTPPVMQPASVVAPPVEPVAEVPPLQVQPLVQSVVEEQPAPPPPPQPVAETPPVVDDPPPLIQPLSVAPQVAPETSAPPLQSPAEPSEPPVAQPVPEAAQPAPEEPAPVAEQPPAQAEPEMAAPAETPPVTEVSANGSAADDAQHFVVLRLSEGEQMEIGSFGSPEEAHGFAHEVVRQIAAAQGDATWPFFAGRFLRPETIVSVDLIAAAQERWMGSSARAGWANINP